MGRRLVSRATYWRRRVVVAAAVATVLGLPIWAVNQALGGSQAPGQGSPRSHAGHLAGPSTRPQTCASGAVLLTLRSALHRYRPGEQVTLVIGAVSTTSRPCRVDLGPRFTSVVVASGGTPVWDSSSCLRGTGSRVVMLRRGAPAFLTVTWDRRISLSGCPGQGTAARAGTYTAAAFNGQLRSQATTFLLSAPLGS